MPSECSSKQELKRTSAVQMEMRWRWIQEMELTSGMQAPNLQQDWDYWWSWMILVRFRGERLQTIHLFKVFIPFFARKLRWSWRRSWCPDQVQFQFEDPQITTVNNSFSHMNPLFPGDECSFLMFFVILRQASLRTCRSTQCGLPPWWVQPSTADIEVVGSACHNARPGEVSSEISLL